MDYITHNIIFTQYIIDSHINNKRAGHEPRIYLMCHPTKGYALCITEGYARRIFSTNWGGTESGWPLALEHFKVGGFKLKPFTKTG